MTIDEYLQQLPALKRKAEHLYEKLIECENKATAGRTANADRIPHRTQENTTETKLIEYADAVKEYSKTQSQYMELRRKLCRASYELKHWQGILIEELYIYDTVLDRETDITEFSEMLQTSDRRKMRDKLAEAREQLKQILTDQGESID